jgi:hypothetical protein
VTLTLWPPRLWSRLWLLLLLLLLLLPLLLLLFEVVGARSCAGDAVRAAGPAQEFGALENFRVRVLPVLGTMPAIFGNAMAAYVLCHIAGQPFECVCVRVCAA